MNVLITGAAGLVGTLLREHLDDEFDIRSLDVRRSRGMRRVDTTRLDAVSKEIEGVYAVIHLAGIADAGASWDAVTSNNLRGTATVLEAARRHGVRRVIFASSNRVTGLYEQDEPYASIVSGDCGDLDPASIPLIGPDWPLRPDSPYGMSKALGEAACRTYSACYGTSTICLRLGTVNHSDRPTRARDFATLLSHADLVRLFTAALRADDAVRHGTYYGVSSNTWRIWDIANATTELGFVPLDDAERFRTGHGATE
ncbi:MAG: NAD-dependent epimerase/dehydratase family protein [Gaiellaceae bacterium]